MDHTTYTPGVVSNANFCIVQLGFLPLIPMTSTSVATECAGAKKIGFQITGAGITTRSAVFAVTVSFDGGTTFQTYNMLISNAANTNGQTLIRVASVTQAATGTTICWMTPETLGGITHIRPRWLSQTPVHQPEHLRLER